MTPLELVQTAAPYVTLLAAIIGAVKAYMADSRSKEIKSLIAPVVQQLTQSHIQQNVNINLGSTVGEGHSSRPFTFGEPPPPGGAG